MKRVERKASRVRLRAHEDGRKPFQDKSEKPEADFESSPQAKPDPNPPQLNAPESNAPESKTAPADLTQKEQVVPSASSFTSDLANPSISDGSERVAGSEEVKEDSASSETHKMNPEPADFASEPEKIQEKSSDESAPSGSGDAASDGKRLSRRNRDKNQNKEKTENAGNKEKTARALPLADLIPSHQPQMAASRVLLILLEEILIGLLFFAIARYVQHGERVLPLGYAILAVNILRIWLTRPMHKVFDFLYRWRWVVALIIFAILVVFQIHFSNAGSYSYRFAAEPSVEQSILLGTPRVIRTDEYSVQLPYYFSQYYNEFQQISNQMSVGGQDMIVGYNAPVWDITLIGKPFTWGYLLFGNAYGLSWYFNCKTILMFMVGLELFHIVCRKRYLAVFGAFILTFAPGMQWWFSPHFYDVIFWSCTLFVVGYWFFRFQGWKKWAMTLLAICSLTGFVLALFPSLQVPCGILMLCLMCACLWRDRQKLSWKWSNLANVFVVLAGTGLVLGPTLWRMREAIELLMNTEYPGQRVSVGGSAAKAAWMYYINPVSPFQILDEPDLLNNSEISSYTHFGVACFLLYPYLWWKLKKAKNSSRLVGDVLWLALLVEGLYMYFVIPEWLAKATLLSMCNRMQTVYSLTATIFTVWTFQIVRQSEFTWKKTIGLVVCAIYGAMAFSTAHSMIYPNYIDIAHEAWILYSIPIILAASFWLTFTRWNQLFLCLMICWTGFSGCMVNPIMQGTASVTDYPLAEAVQKQVEKNPDAWWLTTVTDQTQGLLMANGAKVINGVNFYPDYEKWKLIDPDLSQKKLENRYAHIEINLTNNKESELSLIRGQDLIHVDLAADDLKKLDVSYIVGNETDQRVLELAHIPYKIIGKFDVADDKTNSLDHSVSQDIIFQIKGS